MQTTANPSETVFFIPGFMGSSLHVNGRPAWLDMGALEWGDFTGLKISQEKNVAVTCQEVLAGAYKPLLDALAQDNRYQVQAFPYDWRHSLLEAGKKLGDAVGRVLDDAQTAGDKCTLRILAHSTGGLVVLAMAVALPDLWERVQRTADFRCVMLGTPLEGTFAAVQLLLGQHRLIRLLDLSDRNARDNSESLADQFAGWQGLLELLPNTFLEQDSEQRWRELLPERFEKWSGRSLLLAAHQVRAQLAGVALAPCFVYVHGKAVFTPAQVEMDEGKPRLRASTQGDGVTLYGDFKLQGKQYVMPVEHGKMAGTEAYFPALRELLERGETALLPPFLPQQSVELAPPWLPAIYAELFPDEAELQAAALGYHTRNTREELLPPTLVKVVHGDLEYETDPVLVGHYEGDSIVGTEKVLDRCLGGRLSELSRLGQYPGALKTAEVVFNPGKSPGGAIVVGLGEIGNLSVGELASTVMDALVYYALRYRAQLVCGEEERATDVHPIPISVTTLLIGTVGGGISLADSMASVLRAVGRANQVLEKADEGGWVRIQTLNFLELYEDRAVEAAHLIIQIKEYSEFSRHFVAQPLMEVLLGNRRRVMYHESGDWWRRLQVVGDAQSGGLKYTALTALARAEMSVHATQRAFVDQFIAQATTTSKANPELGKTLFELLLPSEIKDQAPRGEHLALVLDKYSAAYPWEVLQDRRSPESQPLSVRSGMLRQLMVAQPRRVRRATQNVALVIGNPPAGAGFSNLESAAKEAEQVVKGLGDSGFKVTRKIGVEATAEQVVTALLADDYRVLHLAGHGVFQYPVESKDSPSTGTGQPPLVVTGMVLGNGAFLTAAEIRQMGCVPDLVFVNCCHLAHMDQLGERAIQGAVTADRAKFAASFAYELIEMGAKAVVAAGWAIHDGAAKVFSETFYAWMLRGESFGKAVLASRLKTWQMYPETNTWGAYQCYGDAEYRLRLGYQEERPAKFYGDGDFVAEMEVVAELQNLINEADTSHHNEHPQLQKRLKSLHGAIPSPWQKGSSLVLYELGRAYGKLELYIEALEAYRLALEAPESNYPLRLLEDQVAVETTMALAAVLRPDTFPIGSWDGGDMGRFKFAQGCLERAKRTLDKLDKLDKSLVRLEEMGKYYKRAAMIETDEAKRSQCLQEMEQAYLEAYQLSCRGQKKSIYALLNWLTARAIRHLRGEMSLTDLNQGLEEQALQHFVEYGGAAELASFDAAMAFADEKTQEKRQPNFLSGIGRAEYTLLLYLRSARLAESMQLETIEKLYREALARGTTPRKGRYIPEHLAFVRMMLVRGQPTVPGHVLAQLEVMANRLVQNTPTLTV